VVFVGSPAILLFQKVNKVVGKLKFDRDGNALNEKVVKQARLPI